MVTNSDLTVHAKCRSQQRGVSTHMIDLLLQHGDVVRSVGGGRRAITISRLQRKAMVNEGLSRQQLERLGKLCLIEDGQRIITVLVASQRRYRHGVRPRRRY